MKKFFKFTKDSKVIIYGASFLGRAFLERLREKEIEVIYFFDRFYKGEKEIKGVPVVHPDATNINILSVDKYHIGEKQLEYNFKDISKEEKENIIVVVAITDVQEHRVVAEYLYSMGYRNIIMQNDWQEKITQSHIVYESILEGKIIDNINIPCYEPKKVDWRKFEDRYVEKKNGKCILGVPVELLFCERNFDGEICSIYQNEPLLSFYNFMEGRKGIEGIVGYFKERKEAMRWAEVNKLKYMNMTRRLELYGQNVDIEMLPIVKWDETGKFVVESQLEYVMFYFVKGYGKIRCVMSEEDYAKWINIEKVTECYEIIDRYKISHIYTPIQHPALYDIKSKRDNCGYTRLMYLCEFFLKEGIKVEGMKVLDVGSYIGYFSQHMCRMGAKVTSVEYAEDIYQLSRALNNLFGYNNIDLRNTGIEEIDDEEKFDISIMLTVLYWYLDTPLGEKIIEKIDKVTKGMLIWESGDEIEKEKLFILEKSSFDSYVKITDTFGTGKSREMGVFFRKKQ